MDVFYPLSAAGLSVIVGTTGYLVRRVIDTDKTVAAHIAEDAVLFRALHEQTAAQEKVADERHQDLKDRLVRIETKLDQQNGGVHASQ